jgi:D-glycero-D-manno-heptose 1,7-bisphosphate phosphatase
MKRAVFLDRDGTLIVEKNYLHKPEDVEIFPGVGTALQKLSAAGYILVMVTNQAGVGRGYYTMADVEKVHAHLAAEFARDGVAFAQIYVAPEAPGQPSHGRKPSPQFLFDARDSLGLELAQSFMVGDKLIDLECGWNAGVKKSLLVRTGYGEELERTDADKLTRAVVVNGIPEATDWILSQA